MVAYNFPQDMAQAVIFGRKTCAIKAHGKRAPVAVGQDVHAFCGNVAPDWSKSPDCHRLITAPCRVSDPVRFDEAGVMRAGVRVVHGDWLEQLAQQEGFARFTDLQLHVDRMHGFPWDAQMIRWDPAKATFRAQWPLIVKPPEPDPHDTE